MEECTVATSAEFQSYLNQSLSAINDGDWENIDFHKLDYNKQQNETVIELKKLALRFANIVEQNKLLTCGKSENSISRQGHKDKVWHSYNDLSQKQGNSVRLMQIIAKGDLTEQAKVTSKEDELSIAVNQIIENFADTARQANDIALGDYTSKIQPRSEKDSLGKALFLMTRTLREAGEVCNAIATGDTGRKVQVKGNNDQLAMAINQIVENLDDTARQANVIAQGDYSLKVKPRSEKDALGKALFSMTQSLREAGNVCNAIAVGDTSRKVPVKGSNDQLAVAINQIVENLDDTAKQANAIAQGDYSFEVKARSEKDALGNALYLMTQSLREASDVCNSIALGDYSVDISLKGDRDLLGKSLSIMAKNLRESMNKGQREDWLKTGQAELLSIMRGEQDVNELTEKIITYVANYTGAQVGVFYLADDARNLTLTSSYAYQRRKNVPGSIAEGEGILGQAVKEKKTITFSNVPEDYISINSGLGQSSPNNLMVSPILLEGSVKGVIEIGRFGEFDDKTIALLERTNESIAMAINSAHDRVRMQDLLEEAQRSAEELQAQQEELRASNEELEEQTKTISLSEASLKAQQEELQASNEELEEKTEFLQSQKQEILDKNSKIEQSKLKLEDKARELEISSKYKSEFLANMSHELRTPLNSLLILSEMLAENKEDNLTQKQLESAEIIHRGGQDLLNLINDILDLSKVESGKLTLEIADIELHQLQRSISSQFEPLTTTKDFEFIYEIEEGITNSIQTDQMRTLQILKNLISNAFKFTTKGSVHFRIFTPNNDVKFKQEHLNSNNCIGFSVIDTGIGIEQDKQHLIFEAFQQADGSTSRKFGGTGLGLTISRELCRLLGGELHISSQYNKGSTFSVYLPVKNDGQYGHRTLNNDKNVTHSDNVVDSLHLSTPTLTIDAEQAVTPITLPAVETGNYIESVFIEDDREAIKSSDKTVLIIEDDKDFSSVLKGISKLKGYKTLLAGDGKNALHLAAKYQPSAIILDLGLPDLDGIKVLALFKSDLTTRHIPVYIISAREGQDSTKLHGAIGVLEKPTSMDELDKVFLKFDEILKSEPKKLMIIDDDEKHCHSLRLLLENGGIEITEVHSGERAIEMMKSIQFHCIVLDLQLPGISGMELLQKMQDSATDVLPPVVINTGMELSEEKFSELSRFTDKIILKCSVSNERLLDEVMLFLHQTPLLLPDSQRQAIQMLHNEESFFEGRTLLLVDDDLRNTFALSTVLEEKGLNVIIAANGQKALDALEEHDSIEVVLMDIMMPVMDGYEAMQAIRAQDKFECLPIIALTAKAMAEDKIKCLEAGANDYMNKPVKMTELLALLKVSIT